MPAYLDTNARTVIPTSNETGTPLGRLPLLHGVYSGFVKDATDVQFNGRLRVWIPELGSAPDEEFGWITVNYCSPFAGATNVDTASRTNFAQFDGTQTSYGMWMIPPDINNQVMVMFINGDASRGIWIGCLYNQFMNNMVPGMAASTNNHQYPNENIPVAEYNKWNKKTTLPDTATKPYEETKFKGLGNQGLIRDNKRGITTSSARRESPSSVFGILTPGPAIDTSASPKDIRRKGGSAFIMDDGTDSEYIQLTTKSGAQIRIDETNGNVYLINRDGTAWVQMDYKGNIDIFGAGDISMRAQRDLNIRADRNVNIEAGQNIFMKAAQDTEEATTTFTYNVNNKPEESTIPVWKYVGEGQGTGGNIVMQALNNWQSTTKNTAYLTVIDNNMNIRVGNDLNVTTVGGGQNFSSQQGVKITTAAAFDLAAKGNIRANSESLLSISSGDNLVLCTNSKMSLNSTDEMIVTAGGSYSLNATDVGINPNVNIGANLNVTGTITGGTIVGFFPGLRSGGGANTGSPSPGPAVVNPIQSESALSAAPANPAEIKPLNDKINILATWSDPESKFRRNSEPLKTTVTRLATYEPCPEHNDFSNATIAGYKPTLTVDDKTYEGSSGAGNNASAPPPTAVGPGMNNTEIAGDPPADSSISNDVNTAALKCQLIKNEGLVYKSYIDTSGLLHGGIGHLLRANEIPMYPVGTPISKETVDMWYEQDSASAIRIAQSIMGDTWGHLSDIRKRAVIDLAYNLGKTRLSRFTQFIAAMRVCNYTKAGLELKNSKWFTQVGQRGPRITVMIVQNTDPHNCGG